MITIKDYELYSGDTWNGSEEDFNKLEQVAELRLKRYLCLEDFPTPLPDDLAMLLANFIAFAINDTAVNSGVESKSVRNFTVKFNQNSKNAWLKLNESFADIIGSYSQCSLGIGIETTSNPCGEYMPCPCGGGDSGTTPSKGCVIKNNHTKTEEFEDGDILTSNGGSVVGLSKIGTNNIADNAITEDKLAQGVKDKFTNLDSKIDGEIERATSKENELDGKINTKQDQLTETQLNAVNSGITSDKVSKYDDYEDTINGKQDQLTEDQLKAVNSGITSDKVATYDGYQAQIDSKLNKSDVDSELSTTSENPVQNKVITERLNRDRNLVVTTTANPLDSTKFICDYSSTEIYNAITQDRTVVMYFEDTVEQSGNQVYQYLKHTSDGEYFRRLQVIKDTNTVRQIDIKVDYAKNVVFTDNRVVAQKPLSDTAKGDTITLDNSADARLAHYQINASESTQNPDYPQEIEHTKIESVSATGKNLLDYNKINSQDGLTTKIINENVITVQGRAYMSGRFYLEPNTKYYCNFTSEILEEGNDATTGSISIECVGGSHIYSKTNPFTFTTGSGLTKVFLYAQNGKAKYTDLIISKGENPTTYELPKGETYTLSAPIDLYKLGEAQDKLVKKDGVWGVENAISVIESYDGETITTEYMSTTGQLTTGAKVIYLAETPAFTPLPQADQEVFEKLRTYNPNSVISTQGEQEIEYITKDGQAIINSASVYVKGLETHTLKSGNGIDLSVDGDVATISASTPIATYKAVSPSITANETIQPLSTETVFLENISGLERNSQYQAVVSFGQFDMNDTTAQLSLNSSGLTRNFYIKGSSPASYAIPVKTNGSGIVNIDCYLRPQADQPISGLNIAHAYIDLNYVGKVQAQAITIHEPVQVEDKPKFDKPLKPSIDGSLSLDKSNS